MREAMASAEVGDDVFGEDPTVNQLQEETASLLGMEAGLFVPSGTMGNQLAIKTHTQPGDEVILEAEAHIRYYEAAGAAFNSLTQLHPLPGDRGVITAEQVAGAIHGDDVHLPPTGLITLENTHNRAGGTIYPLEAIEQVAATAREHGIPMHLDGARLLNAVVATEVPARRWAELFESVSICFSKGLGAPVGSVLCGSRAFITKAHRYRKILGGGMRQAGIIAAGALFALQHHIDDLRLDHERAQTLASALAEYGSVMLEPSDVHTNIVIFGIDSDFASAEEIERRLAAAGVLAFAVSSHQVRLVTHRDLTDENMGRALDSFRKVWA